jgi:DNA-binding beta-propeller fold protein YncE
MAFLPPGLDGSRSFLVVGGRNNCVQRHTTDLLLGLRVDMIGDKELRGPSGLAVCRGQVIVGDSDFGTIRLLVFNLSDGELDRAIPTPPGMLSPSGMCVTLDGATLLVADDMAHTVFVIPLDANDTTAVRTVGCFGTGDSQFERPVHLAMTPTGELVVADHTHSCIQLIDLQAGHTIRKIDVEYFVNGVAVDSEGNIVVLTPKELLVYSGLAAGTETAGTILHEHLFEKKRKATEGEPASVLKLYQSAEGGLAIDAVTGAIGVADGITTHGTVSICEAGTPGIWNSAIQTKLGM